MPWSTRTCEKLLTIPLARRAPPPAAPCGTDVVTSVMSADLPRRRGLADGERLERQEDLRLDVLAVDVRADLLGHLGAVALRLLGDAAAVHLGERLLGGAEPVERDVGAVAQGLQRAVDGGAGRVP